MYVGTLLQAVLPKVKSGPDVGRCFKMCSACSVLVALVTATCCVAAEPPANVKKRLIQELDDSSRWPKSGKLEGTMQVSRRENHSLTNIVRCDFNIWFAG